MSIIVPANSAVGGGYDVENSCRFDGTAAYLNRTQGTSTNLTKFAWSGWIKRSKLGAGQVVTMNYASASNYGYFYFRGTDDIRIFDRGAGGDTVAISDMLFRDTSAWYHIALIIDTTQATDTNRLKLYVNGILQGLNGVTYPAENAALGWKVANTSNTFLMRANTADSYVGGYLAEVAYVDGTANAITDFGEFDSDSGVWKPIDVSGLTFGNEGYYVDFEDSANLGNDASGGTDFTENSLAAIDQSTDTCTNNFATMNPLDNFYYNGVFTEGNLKIINGSGREAGATSTFAISNGKWFWEAKPKSNVSPVIGIQSVPSAANTSSSPSMQVNGYGYLVSGKVETSNGSGGSTVLASYATYAADDIIGVAVDLDGNKIYFYKNGALQGASGVTITAASATTNGHYFAGFGVLGGQDTFEVNFGSPPFAISSGNQDGNGYGNFEYAVPSGYYALNTKNLAEYG